MGHITFTLAKELALNWYFLIKGYKNGSKNYWNWKLSSRKKCNKR